ncbi:MAG: hypothetical protein KDI60_17320, partial [Xanthomonadales bacterium]|nr:hypothetical protein [Xanthomonadales bacterium]
MNTVITRPHSKGLAQIAAIDGNRVFGTYGRGRRQAGVGVKDLRPHGYAGRGQLGQANQQRLDSILALAVEGDGAMGALAEYGSDQTSEYGAGADLDELADAPGVHGFDHVDEAHRLRQLRRQLRTNL